MFNVDELEFQYFLQYFSSLDILKTALEILLMHIFPPYLQLQAIFIRRCHMFLRPARMDSL